MRPILASSLAVLLLTAFLVRPQASLAAEYPGSDNTGLQFYRVHPLNDSLVIAGGEVFERDGEPDTPAKLPDGVRILPLHVVGGVMEWILVEEPAYSLSLHIKTVRTARDDYNWPFVEVGLDEWGTQLFEWITSDNIGRQLAIALDGLVYSAPVVQEKISGGKFIISGSLSVQKAIDLTLILRRSAPPQALE